MTSKAEHRVQPILYDRARMAEALCVSQDLLDRMMKAGCPFIAVPCSTKRLFDAVDVVAWMKSYAPKTETMAREAAKTKADAVYGK